MAPGAINLLTENLRRAKIKPKKIIAVPNMITLANYIERGKALSILSINVIQTRHKQWLCWKLPAQEIPFHILLIWPRGRDVPLLNQALKHL